MPDIAVNPELFLPPNPLHFLNILRYISMLLILVLVISPREGGGTEFLVLMAVTALLIVTDVYAVTLIEQQFIHFMIRVLAVAFPLLMVGIGTDNTSRQIMLLVALLGLPAILILLFVPWFDPAL